MSRHSKLVHKLFEQRDKSGDVTFIVESERIPAHRNVLAALSEKYEVQFYGPQPDQGDIQVNGVTAAAFKQFIELFYSDEVKLSIEHIGDVLDLAKQSLVDDFVNKCVEFLKREMTTDNLCSVYRLAIAYDLKELKDLCEQKISNDTKALFATEEFVHCDREMLEQILKLDSLSCSEGEVFDACIAWAWAICVEKHIDGSNPANLRAALDDTIFQVRFASMTIENFAVRQKSLEGFFTLEETNEIIYLIGKLDSGTSQMFNRARRDQSIETLDQRQSIQAHNLLKCERGVDLLDEPTLHNGEEYFGFECNRNIRWYGFVISTEINAGVAKIGTGPPLSHYKEIPIRIEKSHDETVVYLVDPVDVIANQWHWIHFDSSDLKGRTVFYSYNLECESNNISFSFDFYGECSLTARLLFTLN